MHSQMLVLILPRRPLQYFLRGRQVFVDLVNFLDVIVMLLHLHLIKMSLDELADGHLEALLRLISL